MRHAGLSLAAAIVLVTMAGGCASAPPSPRYAVHHVVICWLKEPGNPAAMEELVRVSKRFVEIPGVVSVSAGPTLPSDRPVVDSSYDVGILIVLQDEAALQTYLEHPIHRQALRETLQPLVDRIVVYDFVAR
jgi:hypothetical protein